MAERRRAPRHPVELGELTVMPSSVPVQVLEISTAGVLLRSEQPVKPGARGRLRLTVGGTLIAADVEVRRISAATHAGYRVGARFVGISPEHLQAIERFAQ